jgi:outer membrane protein assembly factor BamB
MILLLAALALVGDWPEWRGPHRDGVVVEEPKAWPEKLNLKWKTEVGIGHSSPIVAAGSIYDFAREGSLESVVAIDPANGKIRWKQQYPAPYKMNSAAEGHGEGPKATPVYADGKLYTLGINGILSAFNAETGKPVWRLDFKGSPDFGTAMSPIVDRGMLIAHVPSGLTAFDAATGAVKWVWNGDSPAYASPIVVEMGGVRQVVTQSHSNIVGVAEESGKLLWKIPFTTAYDQNIVTPVVYRDTLIFSGLDKGVFAVRLKAGKAEIVWKNGDVSMYMNSPVVAGDLLFGFSHLKKGQLFCLDARTGATLWTGPPRAGDNAALLAGSGTLYALIADGQIVVAKPTAKGLNEIRRYEVAQSPTWAHPVVLGDGVVIKDLRSVARWGVE